MSNKEIYNGAKNDMTWELGWSDEIEKSCKAVFEVSTQQASEISDSSFPS
jgi:hypothetical protein